MTERNKEKVLLSLKDAVLNMYEYISHHAEGDFSVSDAVNGPVGRTVKILMFERDIKIIMIALDMVAESL